jgi:hypothetical protein
MFGLLFFVTGCTQETPPTPRINSTVDLDDVLDPSGMFETTTAEVTLPEQVPPVDDQDLIEILPTTGIFTISIPSSWHVQDFESEIAARSDDGLFALNAKYIHTGYMLDRESFDRAVNAREENIFQKYKKFLSKGVVQDETGSTLAIKEVENDGKAWMVSSLYRRFDNGLGIVDFWYSEDLEDRVQQLSMTIFESMIMHQPATELVPLYSSELLQQAEGIGAVLGVSSTWKSQFKEDVLSSIATWISPDEHVVLQLIHYDDGEPIPVEKVGDFVVVLLREFYTRDLIISSYEPKQNEKHELKWIAETGGYIGKTYYEVQGTGILLFTVMVDESYEDIYKDYVTYQIDTYLEYEYYE